MEQKEKEIYYRLLDLMMLNKAIRYYKNFEKHILAISILLALVSFASGLTYIFVFSPADYQQEELVRIMYIHVPCAWMSLYIYGLIGLLSISYLIWRNPLLDIIAKKIALIGFIFCLLTLFTGMLWGKPIWGAWWVWDARLTSMFILACLYFSYISLCARSDKSPIPSDVPAILAIVGLVNLPIIKWSVNLWTTLHQPASVLRMEGPSIHPTMLLPLLLMFIGCFSIFLTISILRVKNEQNQRKILRIKRNLIKIKP